MISILNGLEQARNILRELRLSCPNAPLPGGRYGARGRSLDLACKFIETELEGAMKDCVVDPSTGATKSERAPDGKE